MTIRNAQMNDHAFLRGMYDDGYFPDFLVDKVKSILMTLCGEIEAANSLDHDVLLTLTHRATEKINALQDEFDENHSELETVARDVIASDFEYIVRAYGFKDVDIEDVIAPRDW